MNPHRTHAPSDPTSASPAPASPLVRPIAPRAAEVHEAPVISPAEGMRYYAAIIGREPTVDPEAPNLLPRLHTDDPPPATWAHEVDRNLRSELARRLHMSNDRRPSWRELMDAMTQAATRRIEEARRRVGEASNRRKAA